LSGGDGPASADDPESVVRNFWSDLDSGNVDAAREYVHSEQQDSGGLSPTEENIFQEADVSVESTTLVEESGDRATVEATIRISYQGNSNSVTVDHQLRKEGGDWKLYDLTGF